jgi:uncharacterized ferritin-like protein (DUF455 family)
LIHQVHALAHIELNAMDIYWDTILRFAASPHGSALPGAFYADFVRVAADEGRHFGMLHGRLQSMGQGYGCIPAHKGLWEYAEATREDCLARLAIVPLVQEAKGLDAGPRYKYLNI